MPSILVPNSRQAATSVASIRRYPSDLIPLTASSLHRADLARTRWSWRRRQVLSSAAPVQEADRQRVELVELLQLRPVPATAEDVQLRSPDALERHQCAIERVDPVFPAPDQQYVVRSEEHT